MSSILNQGRQAPRLNWQIPMPNLLGSAAEWAGWIKSATKECRENSPPSFQPMAMSWLADAFKLSLSDELLWHVPSELVAFDSSLAKHLDRLMKDAPGNAGKEFGRRLLALENRAVSYGRTTPARKLVATLGFHSIKARYTPRAAICGHRVRGGHCSRRTGVLRRRVVAPW